MNHVIARSTIFAAAIAFASVSSVYAAGSDSDSPPTPTQTTKECKAGEIWDKKKKKCVSSQSSKFSDDDLFGAARETAYAGQYDRAMGFLELAANQTDPRILNYKGFVNRKQGRSAKAMEFYKAALAIDPNYNLARSYMGQGMAADGDVNGARKQLAEIWARGGRDSWAYASLNKALIGANTDY